MLQLHIRLLQLAQVFIQMVNLATKFMSQSPVRSHHRAKMSYLLILLNREEKGNRDDDGFLPQDGVGRYSIATKRYKIEQTVTVSVKY